MRLLTPTNERDARVLYYSVSSKPTASDNMEVTLGYARSDDDIWRNIYSGGAINWTNLPGSTIDIAAGYANQNFMRSTEDYYRKWYTMVYAEDIYNKYTVCITPPKGESTSIDYCKSGFNDCDKGANCILDNDKGTSPTSAVSETGGKSRKNTTES